MHMNMHKWIHSYIYIYIYIYMYQRKCIYIYIYIKMDAYICIYMHTYIHEYRDGFNWSAYIYIYIYIYIYVYMCIYMHTYMHRVFALVREAWVQSQVELFQRLSKWYLIPPCLTFSNIRYVSRVKWSYPENGVEPSSTPRCSSYWYIYRYVYILKRIHAYICISSKTPKQHK